MKSSSKQVERFMSKVRISTPNACWEWVGAAQPRGYGNAWWNQRVQGAHRVSWEIHNGPIPNGLYVLHKCDNPACVNPRHLFLGEARDNVRDMMRKGRDGFTGETNGNAKLTRHDVANIRRLVRSGEKTQFQVAIEYNLSIPYVSEIVNRKVWKHLPRINNNDAK